jgi:hypothetical protein
MTRKQKAAMSEKMKAVWVKRKGAVMGPAQPPAPSPISDRDFDTVISIVNLMDDLPKPCTRYIVNRFM